MNYQKELESVLETLPDKSSTLLLHSCCAPCSSYVLEYLSQYFQITVYYYNPNISERREYEKRVAEQKRLIQQMNESLVRPSTKTLQRSQMETQVGNNLQKDQRNLIRLIEGPYDPERFYEIAKGLEQCKEGGERCRKCFQLRLEQTAKEARTQGFDYFTTTLTISPLKNAETLNEIGRQIQEQMKREQCNEKRDSEQRSVTLQFLPSDFKKKNGYKRSIELSKEYDLYRQDYCGCIYSKLQREEEIRRKRMEETNSSI